MIKGPKMRRMLFLSLLIALCAVAGCAHSLQPKGTAHATEAVVSAEARAEFERKAAERMKEEEGIFDVLSDKMDEYQDLLEICDHISPAAEDSEIKASCASRLKAMRQELGELSELLRDAQ